jgi:hypothetical protein
MRLLLAAVAALGLFILPVQQVAACSCAMFSPEEAAATADVVFAGTVVGAREVGAVDLALRPVAATEPMPLPVPVGAVMYTFEVDGVAKGDVPSQIEILGGGDGASCGMSFGLDERWLVFATWDGATFGTSLCAGNLVLEAGAEAPLPLVAPTQVGSDDAGFSIPIPALAVLGVIAVVLGVSWLAFRRAPGSVG